MRVEVMVKVMTLPLVMMVMMMKGGRSHLVSALEREHCQTC